MYNQHIFLQFILAPRKRACLTSAQSVSPAPRLRLRVVLRVGAWGWRARRRDERLEATVPPFFEATGYRYYVGSGCCGAWAITN